MQYLLSLNFFRLKQYTALHHNPQYGYYITNSNAYIVSIKVIIFVWIIKRHDYIVIIN